MEISVSEAKGHLTELVRRAEAGEEIVLTRHGHAAAKLVPAVQKPKRDWDEVMARIRQIQERVRDKIPPGVTAENCSDFLYDERGLPR
jgi:prevent-host-death family protein